MCSDRFEYCFPGRDGMIVCKLKDDEKFICFKAYQRKTEIPLPVMEEASEEEIE